MRKSGSKSPKKYSDKISDDEIDDLLEHIDLKRPRTSYTHFCIEEIEKFKNKNKGKKIKLTDFVKDCAERWGKFSDKDKAKYKAKFEEDKTNYKIALEKVRHILFKDYNDIVSRPPTAYRLFLNERLREGLEKNLDPKDIRTKASKDWKLMDPKDKEVYEDRKKDTDDWFEKAKHTRKVTALSIFVQKTVEKAKEEKEEVPKLAELAAAWKKLSAGDKKKYIKFAEDINNEREKLQHIWELVNGVKPKRPAGAFRIFLQEKAKEKALKSIDDGKKLWAKLSEEEKEKYLKKAHTCRLAYQYKKMIYEKKIKKVLPKKPANAYGYFLKEKKGQKIPKGEKAVVYWRPYYDKLDKKTKQKYAEKAIKEKDKYQKKMLEFKNYVFDMPKRPNNAFSLYVRDRIPDLKKDKEDTPVSKLIKIAAKEWKDEDGVSQSKYQKKAEQDKKRFKAQLKEFEKLGYYRKNMRIKTEEKESDDETKKSKPKKKRSKSRSESQRSTKRAKSKTQDVSKSRKRGAKSQKKKK